MPSWESGLIRLTVYQESEGSNPSGGVQKNLIFSKFFAIIFIENETKNMPMKTVAGCKPISRCQSPDGTGLLKNPREIQQYQIASKISTIIGSRRT